VIYPRLLWVTGTVIESEKLFGNFIRSRTFIKKRNTVDYQPYSTKFGIRLVIASVGLIGIFIVMHCSIIMLVPADLGVPLYPVAVTVAAYLIDVCGKVKSFIKCVSRLPVVRFVVGSV
jgi:hypothetical protein